MAETGARILAGELREVADQLEQVPRLPAGGG